MSTENSSANDLSAEIAQSQASTGSANARAVIAQLWLRARINAFAHKAATEEYSSIETRYYSWTIITSLLGVLTVILVYVSTEVSKTTLTMPVQSVVTALVTDSLASQSMQSPTISAPSETSGSHDYNIWAVVFTLGSVIFTLLSLYLGIFSNHKRYGIRAEEHKYLMNSYQHIAQRAREAKWEGKPEEQVVELLTDLERDFSLLKARGIEPLDKHYILAHAIVRKVKTDKDAKLAQSFQVDEE